MSNQEDDITEIFGKLNSLLFTLYIMANFVQKYKEKYMLSEIE